jgi:CCR4-NOT transcriptional regulation complex NOT5 subunit
MWKYILGLLATLSADPSQRDDMRHDAIVAVSVARASLERVKIREEEEEEEELPEEIAPEQDVSTQKKAETPACPDGKCNVVIRRRR